ncbi:hypothetical protein [Rhodocyclus purpureus]|uniref:hypothetical protein n=1 Tax=Rhodocyclus purpureus TaxID=1067 RepID=UPI0019117D48|nr:hypothetical protein [Rhodocyclus purpureus]MBK5915122.1 hypothetical protein [Rhodocyclus purpureus]
MTASEKLEVELMETIERLRTKMHGASLEEVYDAIVAAGLRALRPNVELIEWRPAGPELPGSDEEALIKTRDEFSPFSVWTAFRGEERWMLTDGCEPVDAESVLFWAPIPEGPQQ